MGFAGFLVFYWDFDFEPIFSFGEGGTTGFVGFIIFDFGEGDWELILGNGVRVAIFVIGNRDGTAPVALAGN